MCGILGTLPNTDFTMFKSALDRIAHRGPDDAGVWSDDIQISLGHCRLPILDLSPLGHQPMSYMNERYWIVFNGEIYNFVEIRKELIAKGFHFKSNSDTEVVLASYIQWGESCLLKFNGMWAFAIWDQNEKVLFLSRDRFGKKPLFYSFSNGKFIFASEMKAIYPFLTALKPSKDFHWLRNNIFLYEATDKCLIEGIKRFPAGHYGIFKEGNLTLNKYWNTLDHLVKVPRTYEEQVEQFRELFIDACKIRMRSDVPIGTALSGGLDSSATISLMAHIANHEHGENLSHDWQHAFVAAFPGTPLDESFYAKKVVDHINIPATFLNINPLKDIDKLDRYLYLFEELYLTSPIPMIQTYKAVKEYGVSVTIDGHGADELFSGYGVSLFEAFYDAGINLKQIINIITAFNGLLPKDNIQVKQTKNGFYLYLNYIIRDVAKKILRRNKNIYSKEVLNHPNYLKLDHFNRHLYIMSHEAVLPTLLRNYDRYSMINSVEIRMPFMDHRLVTYSLSLPWHSKIKNGYTKSIIRDAVEPFMPKEITYRKTKIGFNSPIVDWMKNELKGYFLDIVNSKDFLESELIDNILVKQQIEEVINNPNASFVQAEKAWNDLNPYLWERAVIRGKGVA